MFPQVSSETKPWDPVAASVGMLFHRVRLRSVAAGSTERSPDRSCGASSRPGRRDPDAYSCSRCPISMTSQDMAGMRQWFTVPEINTGNEDFYLHS